MKVLIRKATIINPLSPFHRLQKDIFIHNGTISDISDNISLEADSIVDQPDLYVSPGWVDIFSNFADPGYEFKETLETGAFAAAAGGFTDVFLIPDTKPVTDGKSQVDVIHHRNSGLPVTIHAIGAITKNLEGRHLAEMYDMQNSGAVAFSDGLHPVQSSGVLLK